MSYLKTKMTARRKAYDRIKLLDASIKEQQDEIERLRQGAYHKRILEGLANQLRKKFKWHTAEVSGPFGIGASISLTLTQYRDKIGDEANKLLEYYSVFEVQGDKVYIRDFRTNTKEYERDTIGALNGMNNPMIEVTNMSIEELHKLIEEIN